MVNAIFVIVGTVIGAGFASGKEIFSFFNVYGFYGLLGLLFSEFVMFLSIYNAFKIILKYNINSYTEFISRIFSKSSFLNNVMCNIINIFLMISFIVMVAGFGSYFSQEFNISVFIGSVIIAVLSFFVFLGNIDSISKINKYVIPFLILIIMLLGLNNLKFLSISTFQYANYPFNWFIRSLLYASYNLVVLFPILISLKKYVFNLKKAKIVSFISILFLTSMALILFFLLNNYFADIISLDLPTVYIAGKSGIFLKYSCGLGILGAIFTTAISSGYGFLNNLDIKNSKSYKIIALTMCLFSILFSNIGFSTLLNMLYPILGFIRIC